MKKLTKGILNKVSTKDSESKGQPESSSLNLLQRLYSIAGILAPKFKQRVCEECNWSMPTFYRKMRAESGKNNKLPFSNAEKEKLTQVFDELFAEMLKNSKDYGSKSHT